MGDSGIARASRIAPAVNRIVGFFVVVGLVVQALDGIDGEFIPTPPARPGGHGYPRFAL